MSDVSGIEPDFRDPARSRLVDELLERFAQVRAEAQPLLVVLEAESGWGKTRILQEFYKRLAAAQPQPAYWPPSIIQAVPVPVGGYVDPDLRRKRIYPESFVPPLGAVPEWFWWGISGLEGNGGSLLSVLTYDSAQIARHRDALFQRIAPRLPEKLRRRWTSGSSGEFWEAVAGDSLSLIAGSVGLAVAPIGVLAFLAKLGLNMRSTSSGSEGGSASPVVLAEELGRDVGRFAKAGVPVIIAVEDLQRADEGLIRLLAQVVGAQDGPVLVLATAVAGELTLDQRSSLVSEVTSSRVYWLRLDDLGPMSDAEKQALVADLLPSTSPEQRALLADKYPTPYLIEIACADRRVLSLLSGDRLTREQVQSLPSTVKDFWKQGFRRLPAEVQEAFMLAVLSSPSSISSAFRTSASAQWDREVPGHAAQALSWTDGFRHALPDVLDAEGEARAWFRRRGNWLRFCHEPGKFELVRELAFERFGRETADETGAFWTALADVVPRREDASDQDRVRLLDEILIALALEGHIPWTEDALRAADSFMEKALDAASLELAAVLGEKASDPDPVRALGRLQRRARALGSLGRYEAAISVLRAGLEEGATLGAETAELKMNLQLDLCQVLFKAGRIPEVLDALPPLIAEQFAAEGRLHPVSVRARRMLAAARGRAGDHLGAAEEFGALAEELLENGAEVREALRMKSWSLSWLGATARVDLAINEARDLVARCESLLTTIDVVTLDATRTLATCLSFRGRFEEALVWRRRIVVGLSEIFGPDSAEVLDARGMVAAVLGKMERSSEAVSELEEIVSVRIRLQGSDHPRTVEQRLSLLSWMSRTERLEEALTSALGLLRWCGEGFGERHRLTFEARSVVATCLSRLKRHDEAAAVRQQLVEDCVASNGATHPDTLMAKGLLAADWGRAGEVDRAAAAFADLVKDYTAVFGPRHPETLETQSCRLTWLRRSSRPGEAVGEAEDLVEACELALGVDHPVTLGARDTLALCLESAGLWDQALAAWESLLQDREAAGAPEGELLDLRQHVAGARRRLEQARHVEKDDSTE